MKLKPVWGDSKTPGSWGSLINYPVASDKDVPSLEHPWAVFGLTVHAASQQMVLGTWGPSSSTSPYPARRGKLQAGSFTRSLGLTLLNFLKVTKGPTHTTSIF